MEKVKSKTAIAKFLDTLPEKVNEEVSIVNKPNIVQKQHGETLICELPSGKKIRFILKSVDPNKCRIWEGNLRIQSFLNENTTKDLKEKISAQGQLVPVLARPLKNDPEYSHEIIYGSRRHYVCSALHKDLKLLEGEMEDNDALLFMDAENAGRESPSLYETSLAYKKWITTGIFQSQGELAKRLGVSRVWVNKIISLSKIPMEIVCAFSNPKNMTLKMAFDIVSKISESQESCSVLIKKAIELKPLNLEAKTLVKMLLEEKELPSEEVMINKNNVFLSKSIRTNNGQEICKISTSKIGKTVISFNSSYPKSKLVSLLSGFEKMAQNL